MRVLILTQESRDGIRDLIAYAEAHPITCGELAGYVENPSRAVGNNPNHVVHVPIGFRCVFAIEEQPVSRCRHLSISVDTDAMLPHPAAVAELMEAFGYDADSIQFVRTLRGARRGGDAVSASCISSWPSESRVLVWIEAGHAVNVLEPIA